ncbi:MAG: PLP-dependent transferase [Anaerolineales bacterium]|nr:PLP-dependent transferase [Anaerolineales bacterium]
MDEIDLSTLAVHAGEEPDPKTGAMRLPVDMATTFQLPPFGPGLIDALLLESPHPPHAYTRWSNPTLRALEERLVALETVALPARDRKKVDAVVTASGMAAVSALLLTVLSQGDHVVASEVCYAGSVELFGQHLPRFGIQVSLVDTSDLDQVREALRPNTRLLYAETPANPILRIADIQALAGIARSAGIPLAVDSTWASPVFQQPLALGADFVVHSLTKYINGHGDALGGVVIGPQRQIQRIRKEMLVHLGGALSPFNAWLILRGAVTLPLRMRQHAQGALQVAEFLEGHSRVSRVIYPGLPSHPHHDLAGRQMSTGGGMLTFQLKGGLGAAITLSERIRIFHYATSLGHAHSLLFYYPTGMYIDSVDYLTPAQKAGIRVWVGEGIVRASIGLESPADLIADLDQALRGRSFRGAIGPLATRLLKGGG